MNLGIGSGEELRLAIVQLQFHLQGSCRGIECVGRTDGIGGIGDARAFREVQLRLEPGVGGRGVRFRHLRVNAQPVDVGQDGTIRFPRPVRR